MNTTVRKWIVRVLLTVAVVLAAFIVWRVTPSLQQNYSWTEMDWNGDGATSIGEFLESADVGSREVNRSGIDCIEYFTMKDAVPIRLDCSLDTRSEKPASE
ncbi:MAG: hypothetical protein AB7S71_04235 [Dongiaceae bacterium]